MPIATGCHGNEFAFIKARRLLKPHVFNTYSIELPIRISKQLIFWLAGDI